MFLKFLLLVCINIALFADYSLQREYEVNGTEIKLSTILPNTKTDMTLYTITPGRHSKKVKTKELLELLKQKGIQRISAQHKYVKFTQKSPVDLSKVKEYLRKIYHEKYKNIKIKSIKVKPRAYLRSLPKKYRVKIHSHSYLKREGVVSIKSDTNTQEFFNYTIDAIVDVYRTRKELKRNSELSNLNCTKKSIILDKFKAMPIQNLQQGRLQSRRYLKKDTVLTARDVRELQLVRRGSNVNVTLNSANISISFSAVALDDAVYGDIIEVKQKNSKILKVKIIGKNRGEAI